MRLNYKKVLSKYFLVMVFACSAGSLANSQAKAANIVSGPGDAASPVMAISGDRGNNYLAQESGEPGFGSSDDKATSHSCDRPKGTKEDTELPVKSSMGGRSWARFNTAPLDLTLLNLTNEQKQKIQQMRKETSTKARDLRQALREKRIELKNLMFDPDVSIMQLKAKHQAVVKLQEQLEETMFEDFLAIRSLLTPEQKKHLPEVMPIKPNQSVQSPTAVPGK